MINYTPIEHPTHIESCYVWCVPAKETAPLLDEEIKRAIAQLLEKLDEN
jgi:hypothetical protein